MKIVEMDINKPVIVNGQLWEEDFLDDARREWEENWHDRFDPTADQQVIPVRQEMLIAEGDDRLLLVELAERHPGEIFVLDPYVDGCEVMTLRSYEWADNDWPSQLYGVLPVDSDLDVMELACQTTG